MTEHCHNNTMDNLRFVLRGDEKLYCFIEACVEVFPDTSKNTVRSWLKYLDIPCVKPTAEERHYFKKNNPYLSSSIGLIFHKDMVRLREYRKDRTPQKRRRRDPVPITAGGSIETVQCSAEKRKIPLVAYSSCSENDEHYESTNIPPDESTTNVPTFQPTPSPTNLPSASSFLDDDCLINDASCETSKKAEVSSFLSNCASKSGSEQPSTSLPSASSFLDDDCPINDASCVTSKKAEVSSFLSNCASESGSEQPSTSTPSAKSKTKRDRSQYQLNLEDASEELKGEVKSINEFYTKRLNSKRDSTFFSKETMKKMIERILCFMFFCKKFQNIPVLSLALFNNVAIVSEYVSHLSNVRKLMPSTITSVLTVAINVVKYNLSEDNEKLAKSHQILAYRRFQRQLSREVRLLSKRSKEGMGEKRTQEFYFAHVLEVLRNLRNNYLETRGIKKARYLHDFTMLATYLRAMPGRSQDIRTLRLHVETEDTPFKSCGEGNFIVFQADQSVVLCQNEFKTAKSTGPTKIDLTDDSELVSYLRKHVQARSTMMLGKSHDYMFMNYRGESFKDSSVISKYIGDLFLREISIKVGTNRLRHAIVTYFKSIDESNDVNVRESLASLMKHSVRYQDEVYNDSTHDAKTMKARNLMRERLTVNVFGEPDDVVTPNIADDSDESSDDQSDLKPNIGDVCSLLDPASTPDEISFFLGKVARFADDGQEAHLMHLEEVEDSDNLYKIKPGKVWKESVKSLIFPIDVVYNNSMAAYELRTSAQDIYDACVN